MSADDDQKLGDEPVTRAELERALRFVHLMEVNARARLSELAATVHAVSETMIAEGQLPLEKLTERRRLTVLREDERSQQGPRIQVSPVKDKYALEDLPQIDCASRLSLCKARCCQRGIPLAVQDLDEGTLRWDYAQPYRLAQREDGYCVYNDAQHGDTQHSCTAYAARPAMCRVYDCRDDRRIWLDFDARVPAP